jgi:ABC-type molybdate transport system substrate-binding protein
MRRLSFSVAALVGGCLVSLSASADEVRVFAASAVTPVLSSMSAVFEKRTGHKVVLVNHDYDLAVLPEAQLEKLGKEGLVADGSMTGVARQGGTLYAAALSTAATDSRPAMSLLVLLSSEETQAILKGKGLSAP